jgi:hypothetical protein
VTDLTRPQTEAVDLSNDLPPAPRPQAELEQLDADVKRYLELDAVRADIAIEMDAIKARLRDGGTQLAPCGVKVTVTPNRRFSAEKAAEVIRRCCRSARRPSSPARRRKRPCRRPSTPPPWSRSATSA